MDLRLLTLLYSCILSECLQETSLLKAHREYELPPHIAKAVLRRRYRRQTNVDVIIQNELNKDREIINEDDRNIDPYWEAPEIIALNCGDPGIPAHGYRTGNSFRFGDLVVFSCNNGYNLVGDYVRACRFSQEWSGTQPRCVPMLCSVPAAPVNGRLSPSDVVPYNERVVYECNAGYYMEGLDYRVCQQNGQLSGAAPTCHLIKCNQLTAPSSGTVSFSSASGGKVPYGGTATYGCRNGYHLVGNTVRTCEGSNRQGVWTGSQPRCQGAICGDPGTPGNGVKQGTNYIFPSGTVNYKCNPGHYLQGRASITCQASGQWSATTPTCNACAQNYYKQGTNTLTQCSACPPNSATDSTGSIAKAECICQAGYTGPNGGPCEPIVCPALPVPSNAVKGECRTTYGAQCRIDCRDGYVRVAGNAVRQCGTNGRWSGSTISCQACAEDMYKAGETTCSRCPEDSYTDGEGHGRTGCICGSGFQGPPGGPCQDMDECSRSNGGCEQTCQNTIGSFRCECTLPGFITDADDNTRCAPKNQCPVLEAPANSGMVCVMQTNVNTQRCEMKCNAGYEHTVRPNGFEECGPSTSWHWSSDLRDIPLLPCQEAIFPGIILEAEYFYWVDHCERLTSQQKTAAIQEFLVFLRSVGVCQDGEMADCSVVDASVHCSAERRKRSVTDDTSAIFRVHLEVGTVSARRVSCRAICDWPEASDRYCDRTCQHNYLQTIEDGLKREIQKAAAVMPSSDRTGGHRVAAFAASSEFFPRFNLENPSSPEFVPMARPPVFTSSSVTCDQGMVLRNGVCAECPAGTFTHSNGVECALCLPGTYQPNTGSPGCLSCAGQTGYGKTRCP